MVIHKQEEKAKKKALKIVIPDDLYEKYAKAKKLAKQKGMVFDIKPEVHKAIHKAVDEALAELE